MDELVLSHAEIDNLRTEVERAKEADAESSELASDLARENGELSNALDELRNYASRIEAQLREADALAARHEQVDLSSSPCSSPRGPHTL
jgi:dynactin complex subunit